MYLSEKPRPIDFYKQTEVEITTGTVTGTGTGTGEIEMAIDVPTQQQQQQQQQHQIQQQQMMILNESSSEDHEMKAPKKRAETWIQEETRSLIAFRREVDGLFNTSKSNRHLWEQISSKMRDKGFDRSPNMCTDKWRNLLKEYKKVKHQNRASASAKMLYYKELEELLGDRAKNGSYRSNSTKLDSYLHFSDKGMENGDIPFGPVEANGRSTVNLERPLDNDGDPLSIPTADTVVTANGIPPWNWRETPGNGGEGHAPYVGRVITVKWGEYTRRIGIDGTTEAIKEAIKSAFGLRTKRAFWLEDQYNIVRCLDRDMPIGNYTLHLDEGISIKICTYDESGRLARTEDKTLYTEEDFRDFLTHRGLMGLREINGYKCLDNLDDLRAGSMYRGW